MCHLIILIVYPITTILRVAQPGGVRAVIAKDLQTLDFHRLQTIFVFPPLVRSELVDKHSAQPLFTDTCRVKAPKAVHLVQQILPNSIRIWATEVAINL
jgi:hypothetical protein